MLNGEPGISGKWEYKIRMSSNKGSTTETLVQANSESMAIEIAKYRFSGFHYDSFVVLGVKPVK